MELEPGGFLNIFLKFWLFEPHFLINFFLIKKRVYRFLQLAVKAVPYRKDFIAQLGVTDTSGEPTPEVEIITEMKSCVVALGRLVNILSQFYKRHRLDNESVV